MSLANKLAQERRSRLAAERLLELKQAELFAANRKLGLHARQLSNEIVETRAEVATVRDENQRVKSDLSAAQKEIERVERRLWHSIETIHDGFAFYSPELELIMANKAYMQIFDGLAEVKPGVSYVTVLQLATEEGIVDTGEMDPADWRQMMIARLQSPDAEPVMIRLWNDMYIRLIDQRGPDGDIISLGVNITDTVLYERKLKDARASAEAANRAKSAFLANMSHEIRTPMNGVVGMADVLRDTTLSEEQQLYVETIKSSGEALLVIINDVLDYSKIEAERLQLHAEAFDLEKSIHDVVMLLQSTARDKGISLSVDYEMFLTSRLIGDPGRIRQILTNLVGNAVKFTNEGSVCVRVRGKPEKTSGQIALRIEVEDTGIGIPPDMIDHVFGEFNQVESERNRQFDGTGLGLAITRQLIKMMGGRIALASEEGSGSCFSFEITIDADGEAEVPHPRLDPGLCHVLIVDDKARNLALLQRQIEELGVKVTACDTCAHALALLDRTVDLVLVDQEMTEMSGLEFSRTAREAGHRQDIILLSEICAKARDDPMSAHVDLVAKRPYLRSDLIAWLDRIEEARAGDGDAAVAPGDPGLPEIATKDTADTDHPPRKMRVLAAEDNRTNRLVFGKMVKALNIEVKFAEDGREAVEIYKSFEPDLIFMDISMPRLDGKEATRCIRELETAGDRHVPIIALTAHAMNGDERDILAAGLDRYLTKPLRKPEILRELLHFCPEGVASPEAAQSQAG